MKMKHAEIEANDDGTYQVEVRGSDESSGDMYGGGKCLRYSAKDLSECVAKIEEGKAELESTKEKSRKQRGKPDKSVTDFVGTSDSDD